MSDQNTIAFLIRQLLTKAFQLVVIMVLVVMVSLYLFTSYTAVVNQAGIVRGGSQRVVKQVLAGADASQTTNKIESILKDLDGSILLGGFSSSRDKVENYWNSSVKPAMNEYKTSKDPANLLSVSEQYFDLTNEMVDKAQTMVDIMAYLLYIVLIAFTVSIGMFLKKVYFIFQERVVEPISALEGSINKLSQGYLS
ncbi:MAG: methyl-accepting chemotaxis protein, partial [Selenomonadaceae bacterium]|nr:methyl-accepting chemotaxis protein [Selenomonadaceae bacterium]